MGGNVLAVTSILNRFGRQRAVEVGTRIFRRLEAMSEGLEQHLKDMMAARLISLSR